MARKQEVFEKLDHLGTGAFAQTWSARVIDPDLVEEWGEEVVAIKIPLNKQKERVLRKEVELAGSLHMRLTEMESTNIVKYLGFEIFDGRLVMVMDYVGGGNLRKIIGNLGNWKRMEITKAVTIAQGILKGLSVIHRRHIVHRDIKPENILMEGEIPKISDLGIARMLKTNELASTTTGTLYYMSPELLYEESGASFNTDIWSFGITFYEMLCGEFPFGINEKMPPGRVMSLIRDENVRLVFPEKPAISPQLQSIITKSLERNPNSRHKTANEVLRDVKRFCEGGDDAIEREIGLIRQILDDPTQASIAEERLKEILRKFPESPRAYIHLGEFHNKCGNYDKAIKMFGKGIEKEPQDALLHWDLAIAYQKKGDFRSAVGALEEALELGLETSLERYASVLLKTLRKKV